MIKKTIQEWEKEKNCIIVGDPDISEKVAESEFEEMRLNNSIGVDWEHRLAFLESCGYETTRENIIDSSLNFRNKK